MLPGSLCEGKQLRHLVRGHGGVVASIAWSLWPPL